MLYAYLHLCSLVDSPPAVRQDIEPAGMYRLCKKLDDDNLCTGMARSKPAKKSRKDRRKVSVVSVCVSLLWALFQCTCLLYWVFILAVILYGAETWSCTRQLERNLGAFDQWCLRRILHISWRATILNEEVHGLTDQPPLTHVLRTTCLKFSTTLHVTIHLWTTGSPQSLCGPSAEGLESPIWPTASDLALDCWV